MSERTTLISSRIAFALSVALFVASLFGEAYTCSGQTQGPRCGQDGIGALFWGSIMFAAIFGYPSMLAWYANPVLLAACICLYERKRRTAMGLAALALVFGLSFLFVKTLPGGTSADTTLTGVGAGYWVWLASMAMAGVSAFLLPRPLIRPSSVS